MADEVTTEVAVPATAEAPAVTAAERDAATVAAAEKIAMEAAPPEEEKPEGQAPPEEAPAEEPADDARMAPKLAELARRDRALRAREQQWKAQLREFEQMKAALHTLKDDPVNTLLNLGVDLQKLVESNIGQDKPRADPDLEELKQWKAQVEGERQQAHAARVYQQELAKIKSIADAAPDDHEAVLSKADGLQRVFNTLDGYYRRTGLIPAQEDYIEAVRVVEEAYRQEELKELESLAKAKRHLGRLQFVGANTPAAPAKAAAPRAPTKTLSQELQRESPPRSKPQTEEERVQEAIRLLADVDVSRL